MVTLPQMVSKLQHGAARHGLGPRSRRFSHVTTCDPAASGSDRCKKAHELQVTALVFCNGHRVSLLGDCMCRAQYRACAFNLIAREGCGHHSAAARGSKQLPRATTFIRIPRCKGLLLSQVLLIVIAACLAPPAVRRPECNANKSNAMQINRLFAQPHSMRKTFVIVRQSNLIRLAL